MNRGYKVQENTITKYITCDYNKRRQLQIT